MQDSEAGRLTQIKRGNLLTKNPKIKLLAIKKAGNQTRLRRIQEKKTT